MQVIPIFFTIDEGYAPYLGVCLTSLIENANKEDIYDINIIHEPLKVSTIRKLKSFGGENIKINFYEMKEEFEGLEDRMGNRLRADYFTLSIFFRLFIPKLFPELKKGIYIDSDTVVLSDIAKLYNTDLEGNLLGACMDASIQDSDILVNYIENAIGLRKDKYINSGVLLMNLEALRDVKLDERFLYLLNKYHFDCIAPDQDYLNALCKDKILYLDNSWDAMPQAKPIAKPNLVHYNLFAKPWLYDDILYGEYFWKYAKKSPFYEEVLSIKNNYSKEEKDSDDKHFNLLLKRAEDITKEDITFKNIMDIKEKRL